MRPFLAIFLIVPLAAQTWDPGDRINAAIGRAAHEKLKFSFEFRSRYEHRDGPSFGRNPDVTADLVRTRVGVTATPVPWLKVSALAQDGRSPWYGPNAPNNIRDPLDLQEGYVELFGNRKTGWQVVAGRQMLAYGEGRLIGSPQWAALARTWDAGRVRYRLAKAEFEFLVVSPIKVRIGEFNVPVFGDRIWGMYNVFPNLIGKTLLETYILRHDQNRIGGFVGGNRAAGTDRLGVNTFGGRWVGKLVAGWTYSLEGALQNGRRGPLEMKGAAWHSAFTHKVNVAGRAADLSLEYNYASKDFDQMYPAIHDKYGHIDAFAWRNLHNARALLVTPVSKALTVNLMYDEFWLVSKRDPAYAINNRPIAQAADGSAGRYLGREFDAYSTYRIKHWQFGAGVGYVMKGGFVKATTPGATPWFAYLFHTYSF